MLGNAEQILRQSVAGFHQYVLTQPVHLEFVSDGFCALMGLPREQLLNGQNDSLSALVHPADREVYGQFLKTMGKKPASDTLQFRIVKPEGQICYVQTAMTSQRLPDGTMIANATLTDITQLKLETQNLQYLNDTMPCGFLKYTCQRHPRITYMNDQMRKILGFPRYFSQVSAQEAYQGSIYWMIPLEERRKMARYLNRVYTSDAPIAGEITVMRYDGRKAHLFGWVTKCLNEQGVEEFQSACMDITDRYEAKKRSQTTQYLQALTDVYDLILQYDCSNNTAKCLYGQKSMVFRWLENISLQMEDALDKWIGQEVLEEDRQTVRQFVQSFCKNRQQGSGNQPWQMDYRGITPEGNILPYKGLFLKIDDTLSWFCCRQVPSQAEEESLRSENRILKKNMQDLVMHFTDGLAAFELRDGFVTPLYVSDNVCEFFGFSKEEWMPMMQKRTPIQEFVAHSDAAYEEFLSLLQNGQAEFTYFDLKTQKERRIKAVCSQKTNSPSVRYVMLYNMEESPRQTGEKSRETSVFIRTFGYFDVFVGEKPIAFRNKKSKELLALLVDRRGGYVTSEEAIAFLWEEEPINTVTLARYRKVALRLKNILEEYGISHIVESVDGKRRLVTEKVRCDLYDHLSGKSQGFKGSYLTNYSWGETTLAELSGDLLGTS